MRARKIRTGGERRTTAVAEPLEGRSYLSMTIDVRVAGGAKAATATRVGQVINLQAYAVISGTTAGSNDAFLDAVGSFLGTEGGTGGVVGNLAATLIPAFVGAGASDGVRQDLNGDGGVDVGSNSTTDASGYFAARSGNVDYDGAVSGDTNSFLLATLTYTVTSLGTGAATTGVNFRPSGSVENSYSGVWYQDGTPYFEATADANFRVGSAVVISAPTATPTPTPTATPLAGTTYGTPGSYGNIAADTIAAATDGNPNTFFDAPTATGGNVGLDLGSARAVSQIGFAPRAGYASRMVGGVFQVSTSMTFSSDVITVYTVTAAPTAGVLTTVTPSTGTAYQYWRYLGPANGYCDIAEFELFGTGTTPTPTTTQLTGTTYGTSGSYGNVAADTITAATDGNLNTFFDAPTASGGNVGLDLGSAKTVTQIRFAPRSGYASRMVGGVFQYSTSPTFADNITTVYTVTAAPAAGVLTTVNISAPAERYWRYLSPANGYGNIAEFQLFGPGTTTAAPLGGTTYGTPGSYGNIAADTISAATDGNLNTFFDAPTASGGNVGLDLGSARTVTQIQFAPRSGFASRMVGGQFQVSASMTFSSNVTTVYTVTSAPAVGSLTPVNLSLGTGYRYWRYIGPANGYCDIAEFELFG